MHFREKIHKIFRRLTTAWTSLSETEVIAVLYYILRKAIHILWNGEQRTSKLSRKGEETNDG